MYVPKNWTKSSISLYGKCILKTFAYQLQELPGGKEIILLSALSGEIGVKWEVMNVPRESWKYGTSVFQNCSTHI